MELIKVDGNIQCCEENVEYVLSFIREGSSLRQAAISADIPYNKLLQWLRNSPDFKSGYQESLEFRAHSLHHEAISAFDRIADGTEPMTKEELDRERTVVDIALKLAKLDNPKQYGDKVQFDSTHKAIVIITGVPENIGVDLGKALFGRDGELDKGAAQTATDKRFGGTGDSDPTTAGEPKPGHAEGTGGDW